MSNSNIGTQDEAEVALLVHIYNYEGTGRIPEGWDYLGSGVHRFAYSSPSGYVYKVPANYMDRDCANANQAEATGAAVLSTQESDEFGIPMTNLFYVEGDVPIVVMENCGDEPAYVEGDQKARARAFYRNTDTHGGNMRTYKGKIYMIDLGFFDPNKDIDSCACCSCCPCACGKRR
jgi:hypothetical protein